MECGPHDELISKPHGRYKRLFESSKRRSTVDSVGLRSSGSRQIKNVEEEEKEEEIDWEEKIAEEEKNSFSVARARQMARPDAVFLLLGALGAVICGGVFPTWGILFRFVPQEILVDNVSLRLTESHLSSATVKPLTYFSRQSFHAKMMRFHHLTRRVTTTGPAQPIPCVKGALQWLVTGPVLSSHVSLVTL